MVLELLDDIDQHVLETLQLSSESHRFFSDQSWDSCRLRVPCAEGRELLTQLEVGVQLLLQSLLAVIHRVTSEGSN